MNTMKSFTFLTEEGYQTVPYVIEDGVATFYLDTELAELDDVIEESLMNYFATEDEGVEFDEFVFSYE